MPEEGVKFVPRDEILSFEEIERFARIAVGLGIDKLRVTGGEPLVRRDLPVLIRRLAAIPGIRRSGPDHQRRASWRSLPNRFMTPACGGSTCIWIRSTASASTRSRAATIWTRCWKASRWRSGWGLVPSN